MSIEVTHVSDLDAKPPGLDERETFNKKRHRGHEVTHGGHAWRSRSSHEGACHACRSGRVVWCLGPICFGHDEPKHRPRVQQRQAFRPKETGLQWHHLARIETRRDQPAFQRRPEMRQDIGTFTYTLSGSLLGSKYLCLGSRAVLSTAASTATC